MTVTAARRAQSSRAVVAPRLGCVRRITGRPRYEQPASPHGRSTRPGSIALTGGVNLKWLAEYCGTSIAMIETHYGRFLPRATTINSNCLLAMVRTRRGVHNRNGRAEAEGRRFGTVPIQSTAQPGRLHDWLSVKIEPTRQGSAEFANMHDTGNLMETIWIKFGQLLTSVVAPIGLNICVVVIPH